MRSGWKILFIIVLVLFLGWGIFKLEKEKIEMQKKYLQLKATTDALVEENKRTKEQIEYYKNPENLLKASKERFNFKSEGEKMIIIVPQTSASSSQ